MGRLIGFIFKLVLLVVVLAICTAVVMVFDGLNDSGAKADAALVATNPAVAPDGSIPVLDRVVEMHRTGEITSVIVVASNWNEVGRKDAVGMAKYLETHGVPSSDIIRSTHGGTMEETSRIAAELAREHQFASVMIVADYYDITRLRIALHHEGLKNVEKVHVGSVQKEDAAKIAGSLVSLYEYVGKVYLLPEAAEVKKEAQVGMDKVSADAEQAKDKVNKGLDNLPK
jgi:uncharacterized SAM-binding protein YcdF (DUF218 family)